MDNLFEILVPLIIAGVYFFGNMLSNKSDDDAAPGSPPRASDEDADAIERQRRIQDEIRRKIMERRRAEQGGEAPSQPAPQTSHPAESAADANLRDALEQRRRRQAASRIPEPVSPIPQSNPYEFEMQAKLEQIEATKRQAEALKKQAKASSRTVSAAPQSKTATTYRTRGPIRSTLHDPAAVRAAFIYGEVLGPPVSQRKSQTVPGLS